MESCVITLRYFTEFVKPVFQHSFNNRVDLWRNLCTSLLQCVYDVVVKKVHLRYLIPWWVSCFYRCYLWGATSGYRLKICVFAPTVSAWPKISGKRVVPTNNSSQKTRIKDFSYKNLDRSFLSILSYCPRLTGRDTFLVPSPRWHSSLLCETKKEKTWNQEKRQNSCKAMPKNDNALQRYDGQTATTYEK